MLIGENKLGELVDLSQKEKKEIGKFRKEGWYCPSCKESLIIKNGDVMCSHFSHKKSSNCTAFSENESREHLLGKKILAENCEKYGVSYKIEAYLPKLNQRPDILIANKYAIEFQCSSLSVERFKERTLAYQKNGYQVIWILGKRLQVKEKISSLQQNFVYLSKQIGFYLWELEVETKILRNVFLLTFTAQKLLKKIKRHSLLEMNILSILDFPKNEMEFGYHEIKTELNFFHQIRVWNHRLNQKQRREMRIQAYFYENNINIREFPCVLFLPSYQSILLKEKEWVVRHLIYDLLEKEKDLNKSDIFNAVFLKLEKLEFRDYPLIGKKKLTSYHTSLYLCFLEQTGIVIRKGNRYTYQKRKLSISDFRKEFLGNSLKYVMISK